MQLAPGSLTLRVTAAVSAVAVLALAFGIRAVADDPVKQHSGTALYTSLIYCLVVFVRPLAAPLAAAAIATGFSYAVEVAQLTGVPAMLSQQSVLARLALGVQFDVVDLIWYPVGALLLMIPHLLTYRAIRACAGA